MAGSDAMVKLFAIRKYSKLTQKQLYNVQLPLNINVWIKAGRYFKNKGIVVKKELKSKEDL